MEVHTAHISSCRRGPVNSKSDEDVPPAHLLHCIKELLLSTTKSGPRLPVKTCCLHPSWRDSMAVTETSPPRPQTDVQPEACVSDIIMRRNGLTRRRVVDHCDPAPDPVRAVGAGAAQLPVDAAASQCREPAHAGGLVAGRRCPGCELMRSCVTVKMQLLKSSGRGVAAGSASSREAGTTASWEAS